MNRKRSLVRALVMTHFLPAAVAGIIVTHDASAATTVLTTIKNKALKKYGYQSACQIRRNTKLNKNKGVFGIIRKKKFVNATSAFRQMAMSTSMVGAIKRAKTRCAATARTYSITSVRSAPIASCSDASLVSMPEYRKWKDNMLTYGHRACNEIKSGNGSFDEKLGATYYDAEWVFYQIADFTGDSSWRDCAQAAERMYRDQYVIPQNGKVPGRWNFTQGLLKDFVVTRDQRSKEAIRMLTTNAEYTSDQTPLSFSDTPELAREVAHAAASLMDAESAGLGGRGRTRLLIDQCLSFMDGWFVRKDAPYIRPFMVGITSRVLIQWAEKTGDARVLAKLRQTLPVMWQTLWVESANAFQYTDRETSTGGTGPAVDLNLLIAPSYAWVYRQTGDASFLEMADKIFKGGVNGAYLLNSKQFDQSYRWSFDYVKWRCR